MGRAQGQVGRAQERGRGWAKGQRGGCRTKGEGTGPWGETRTRYLCGSQPSVTSHCSIRPLTLCLSTAPRLTLCFAFIFLNVRLTLKIIIGANKQDRTETALSLIEANTFSEEGAHVARCQPGHQGSIGWGAEGRLPLTHFSSQC